MSEDNDWDKITMDEDDITTEDSLNTVPLLDTKEEEEEDNDSPHASQIVSIGTEENQYAFTFHEDSLNAILSQIPPGWKVCVVSVVGAFRTGKSFLLSWFLQYLNYFENLHKDGGASSSSDHKDGAATHASTEDDKAWYQAFDSIGNKGFHWRGGEERNTTGIWMWSRPYFLPRCKSDGTKETIAVLLVDTQGMFDHETTVGLTASIFGLSTLLSSYQIYNIDKRIQEDNLQQLALFSEYGRMALQSDTQKSKPEPDLIEETAKVSSDENVKSTKAHKPFQQIEFLVRDWQNFDDDTDLDQCERQMQSYLDKVLAEREASDLKDTREQITSCFDKISCFLMTHPGFAVTKKTYEGNVSVVDPTFIAFLDRYCHRVFGNLIPKSIHGRELTSGELGTYIQSYAKMFESGANFPEAATMLEATANANNTNASNLSVRQYKDSMDRISGAKSKDYIAPNELEDTHRRLIKECSLMFDNIATFGNKKSIESTRNLMLRQLEDDFQIYAKLNDSRNPLLGIETYLIPILVGLISMVSGWVLESTCTKHSHTCRVSHEFFSHVYQVVFFFLIIVGSTKAKQISDMFGRIKHAWEAMNSSDGSSHHNKKTN